MRVCRCLPPPQSHHCTDNNTPSQQNDFWHLSLIVQHLAQFNPWQMDTVAMLSDYGVIQIEGDALMKLRKRMLSVHVNGLSVGCKYWRVHNRKYKYKMEIISVPASVSSEVNTDFLPFDFPEWTLARRCSEYGGSIRWPVFGYLRMVSRWLFPDRSIISFIWEEKQLYHFCWKAEALWSVPLQSRKMFNPVLRVRANSHSTGLNQEWRLKNIERGLSLVESSGWHVATSWPTLGHWLRMQVEAISISPQRHWEFLQGFYYLCPSGDEPSENIQLLQKHYWSSKEASCSLQTGDTVA